MQSHKIQNQAITPLAPTRFPPSSFVDVPGPMATASCVGASGTVECAQRASRDVLLAC
jgi:hypothetical protein